MLNRHFGFSCSPFENTLDQRFLFLSKCHEEVIEALLYFIDRKKSFAMVCGDVGMGKTMIVHHLLAKLPECVLPILVPYPDVEYLELLRYIARVLQKSTEGKGVLELTADVKGALTEADLDGKQVVLIIDEAHLLSINSLENIRLLSNIETTEKNLLQILLIGQNELGLKLRRSDMRQLRQRININCVLSPMSSSETIQYIDHRMRIAGACFDHRVEGAGSCFDGCFEPDCKKPLYEMTGGVPRSINQLCDTALLICMNEQREYRVTRRILEKAHRALNRDLVQAPALRPAGAFSRAFSYVKGFKPAFTAAGIILLLALGVLGYRYNLGERLRELAYRPDVGKELIESVAKRPVLGLDAANRGNPAPGAGDDSAPVSLQGPEKPHVVNSEAKSPDAGPEAVKLQKVDESAVETGAASPTEGIAGSGPAVAYQIQADRQPPGKSRDEHPEQGVEQAAALKRENPDDVLHDTGTQEETKGLSDYFIVFVRKGESLSKIAKRLFPDDPEFGRRLILSANPHLVNQDLIFAGRTLRVPRKGAQTGSDYFPSEKGSFPP
ncbi:MAG TPA: AAA family ATPase [Syntrophobacteraceae bacterium]|nr:AAA family ATPase [Syntrophobacteraceae bacterium]